MVASLRYVHNEQLSTIFSTAYLIAKASLFQFAEGTWLPELVIFGSFLVPWLEVYVWFHRRKEIQTATVSEELRGNMKHSYDF